MTQIRPLYTLAVSTHIYTVRIDWILISKACLAKGSYLEKKIPHTADADSSTDAIGGWTKANSAKKKFFFARRF